MRVVLGVLITLVALTPSSTAQQGADRERARLQNRLGEESMRAEAWPQAAKHFQQAIDLDPTYEYAYYGLGRANMAMKKYPEAITVLERCRELYRAQTGRQFANAQEAQRYRRDRILEIDDQIRQVQSMPQSMRTADLLRQLQNVRREEQDRIERGNNMNIDTSVPAFVSISLGSASFRSGKLADAEREYKAAVASDPKSGEAHSNLAVVYLETGRYDDAEKSVKAAEKAGFRVHPLLKDEIKKRRSGT
jgi:tetratricopeptide (TPR) repeat protein